MIINIVEVRYDREHNVLEEEQMNVLFSVKDADYYIEHCGIPLYYYINDTEINEEYMETWNMLAINERNKIRV